MAAATFLSINDKNVLSALFDSEGIPSRITSSITQELPALPGVLPSTLRELQDRETKAIKPLNAESPARQQIEDTIQELSAIIQSTPEYSSAWNNRAQAIRMIVGDDLSAPAAASSTMYLDLCQAIQLAAATPNSDPRSGVSPLQRRILASAFTHRAHLLYKASKSIAQDPSKRTSLQAELQGVDSEMLEKMATSDFRQGGKYGNAVAKQMAVKLNPYAKLCGEIVREAMINDMKESGVIPSHISL
ncbi:hypothetical protein BP5796_09345 [Coleophoma crateriformis]|uniref:Uncharacterized protein n=1 Tax=Coleophoma crateriformis TaxID=565419 RepID=A0A3D8QXT1_9HELO|nr:hypothetical protein BP5796_09345 [Coleophoma crateriformis]